MTERTLWRPLLDALGRRHNEGLNAVFWIRDDDAIEPTPALDRFLTTFSGRHVPSTLAVIPGKADPALFLRLAQDDHVTVAPHGWSHHNHAPPGEKKQELGPHRPDDAVLREIREGFVLLQKLAEDAGMPQARIAALAVPPWNRIARSLLPRLADQGFAAVSVFGRADNSVFRQLNTHVDIIDWHGTRGGRPTGELVDAIAAQLEARTEKKAEPIGILTHHLVHDAPAWDFLEDLVERLAGHPAARWASCIDLLHEEGFKEK